MAYVRRLEEKEAFIAEHSADVLLHTAPDWKIASLNRRWMELSGVNVADGTPLWKIAEEDETLQNSLLNAFESGSERFTLIFQPKSTVKEFIAVKGAFRFFRDESGTFLGAAGVLTDISELAPGNETQGNARVLGSTAAAHLVYLENIFHEIRTPLNLLQGGLHQLRELEPDLLRHEALEFIEQGTAGLASLLNANLVKSERCDMASGGLFHPSSSRPAGQTPVLIVDDIKANRQILVHIMKGLGFQECDMVESGEAAMEIWNRRRHPLILLDYQMEGLDGYETCRRIRASTCAIRPTILGVSASALAENMGKALEAGFCAQIPKPVSKALIKQTLESLGWQFSP